MFYNNAHLWSPRLSQTRQERGPPFTVTQRKQSTQKRRSPCPPPNIVSLVLIDRLLSSEIWSPVCSFYHIRLDRGAQRETCIPTPPPPQSRCMCVDSTFDKTRVERCPRLHETELSASGTLAVSTLMGRERADR